MFQEAVLFRRLCWCGPRRYGRAWAATASSKGSVLPWKWVLSTITDDERSTVLVAIMASSTRCRSELERAAMRAIRSKPPETVWISISSGIPASASTTASCPRS